MSTSQPESSVRVLSIAIKVRWQFGQHVHNVFVRTESEKFQKEVSREIIPDHEHEEEFNPALQLSTQDRLTISMQHGSSRMTIPVKVSDVLTEALDDGRRKRTYFKLQENIEVSISIVDDEHSEAPLSLIPDDVRKICPRYRVLIIGNSGVGKSSLIRTVFGIKNVHVSHTRRGVADINKEHFAMKNEDFIVHDSLGFEAGETENSRQVYRFIEERVKKDELKDRLHAIWVCLAIPYAKGRFMEAGVADFLEFRKKFVGNVPVIVVLTQLDLLDRTMILAIRKKGNLVRSIEEATPFVVPLRESFLDEFCRTPLLREVKCKITQVCVSTERGFGLEPTIPELIKVTTSEIENFIRTDSTCAGMIS